jgi:decaprenylphospho-beta-D-ribofuranose 2-oxidase
VTLSGWGRFPRIDCEMLSMRDPAEAQAAVQSHHSLIARGNGRSYGDAALNPRAVLSTLRSDRILAFDPDTGRVTCEAGLTLTDLLAFVVPRGFFPPVTPGTRFVTIGGMIAADVHGKNHHRAGSFGAQVESLTLLTADGSLRQCSRTAEPALFAAVLGGMGLLGVILDATFRLLPIETVSIRQETLRAANLAECMALFEASADWTYSVAWIDCVARGAGLGRSLLYRGEHARRDEVRGASLIAQPRRERSVPLDLPGFVLNPWSVRAFNEVYFRRGKPGTSFTGLDSFFYPLDALLNWNRIYGRRGFVQYQCVIPRAVAPEGMHRLIERIAASGRGSFLAVLKLFGAEGDGPLSFPLDGYTLALDFPADTATFSLLLELDAIVADYGGRVYLAKDARTGAASLQRGYPRLEAFRAMRHAVDPAGKFASLQSERLGL